jgi:hypothetical protein
MPRVWILPTHSLRSTSPCCPAPRSSPLRSISLKLSSPVITQRRRHSMANLSSSCFPDTVRSIAFISRSRWRSRSSRASPLAASNRKRCMSSIFRGSVRAKTCSQNGPQARCQKEYAHLEREIIAKRKKSNTGFGLFGSTSHASLPLWRRDPSGSCSKNRCIYSGPSRFKASGGHCWGYVKLCVHRGRAMRASDEVTGATNEGLGLHSRPWRYADP